MNIEDLFAPFEKPKVKDWQMGNLVSPEMLKDSIALIFCSDDRGANGKPEAKDFSLFREVFYKLSKSDFEIPVSDLGDLISGKNNEDTHYVIKELVHKCLQDNILPIIIGGSLDLSYALAEGISLHKKSIQYTQINPFIDLENEGGRLSEKNYLYRLLSEDKISISKYNHIGYQTHLVSRAAIKLLKEVDFNAMRLGEIMGDVTSVEPFFRRSDLTTVSCDAVESFGIPFSFNPNVNGLNNREICAIMKEVGMGERLSGVGIFNFNYYSCNKLNIQLLAQMLWYLVEGINIQRLHPKERNYETFFVMINDTEYCFKRDSFSGLWYFGNSENIEQCIPCTENDYHLAKKGILNIRLQ
ncbi:formimidoylglutamase [Riemerella columbipharyngis]|uniref:Arginase family enzyme n=1 Tax=Riemerella columbipharyngis TaxID=1071918 RepID=A0A1G7ELB9_9FLAO|nr:formimidoylglutamase [Riemerella columbipharyngis]SDE64422.1 Arginase family enzyme [Riemerella columbipharyngis]